jgi:hypothetical protein
LFGKGNNEDATNQRGGILTRYGFCGQGISSHGVYPCLSAP